MPSKRSAVFPSARSSRVSHPETPQPLPQHAHLFRHVSALAHSPSTRQPAAPSAPTGTCRHPSVLEMLHAKLSTFLAAAVRVAPSNISFLFCGIAKQHYYPYSLRPHSAQLTGVPTVCNRQPQPSAQRSAHRHAHPLPDRHEIFRSPPFSGHSVRSVHSIPPACPLRTVPPHQPDTVRRMHRCS